MHPRALRRLVMSGALVLAALLGSAVLAPAAGAAGSGEGWVRAAHFSPDTPRVDVYLSPFGRTEDPTVLEGVGYGAVSQYFKVPAGSYTVAMRGAGADPATPPVIELSVQVGAGTASTVAGVGQNAELDLIAYADDLTAPADGQSKVRVVQAALSAPRIDSVEVASTPVARSIAFTDVSPYAQVQAGSATIRAVSGSVVAEEPVDLRSAGTYTVVVRDVANGIDVFAVQDAAASRVVPEGGVDAGQGALAGLVPAGDGATGLALPWVLAGGAALLGLGIARLLPVRPAVVGTRGGIAGGRGGRAQRGRYRGEQR